MELKRSRLLFSFFLTLMVAAFIALPGMALADDEAVSSDPNTTTGQTVEADSQDAQATSNEKTDGKTGETESANNQSDPAGGNSQEVMTEPTVNTDPTPSADNAEQSQPADEGVSEGEGADDATQTDPAATEGQQEVQSDDVATDGQSADTEQAATTEQAASVENQATAAAAATTAAVTAKATTAKTAAAKTSAKKTSKIQPLEDGWYYIQSTKLLSVLLTSVEAGKNAVVKADKAAKRQRWYVAYNAMKKAYTLYNESAGKYLAIKNTKKGANVYLIKSGTKKKSLWIIRDDAAAGYTLKAYSCKYYLDINKGKKVKSGANVDIYKKKTSNGTTKAYQRWNFLPIDVDYSVSNAELTNGYYTLSMNKANTQSVTVPNSSKSNGLQLVSNKYESELNQKYFIQKQSDGTYTLKNLASAKYLTTNGSKVVQQAASGDDTQKWRAVSVGGNAVSFVNVASGRALSIASASTADGTKVVAGNPRSIPAQRFTVKRKAILDNGNFYLHMITGAETSNVATVTGGSKANGAKLTSQKQTYYNDFGTFKIQHLGGGVYEITNINSDKALVASGSNAVQGTTGNDNAKWRVTMNSNGGVVLTNVGTKKVLSLASGTGSAAKTANANVSDTTQSWHVQKAQVLKAYQKKALKKVKKRDSIRNYYLFVDLGKARMMIWERANKKAEWHLKYDYIVAYGRIEGGKSRTPTGDYTVKGKKRWLDSAGDWNGYWSAPYAVLWSWAWFHARTHAYKHSSHIVDKRLGLPISNGCVRQPDFYAKWVYDNHKKLRNASVTVWKNGRF